jgi:hypothetical protein
MNTRNESLKIKQRSTRSKPAQLINPILTQQTAYISAVPQNKVADPALTKAPAQLPYVKSTPAIANIPSAGNIPSNAKIPSADIIPANDDSQIEYASPETAVGVQEAVVSISENNDVPVIEGENVIDPLATAGTETPVAVGEEGSIAASGASLESLGAGFVFTNVNNPEIAPFPPFVPAEGVSSTPKSADTDPAFKQMKDRSQNIAKVEKTHTESRKSAQNAQAAAPLASNEKMGQAQTKRAGIMAEQKPKAFNEESFKKLLMDKIIQIMPKNAEQADDFVEDKKMDTVSTAATRQVNTEKANSGGAIESTSKVAPNPNSEVARPISALKSDEAGKQPGGLNAAKAMPPARGEGEVSQPIKKNVEQVDQQIDSIGVPKEVLRNSGEPQVAKAMTEYDSVKESSASAPQKFRTDESKTLNTAKKDSATSAEKKLAAMHAKRSGVLNQVGSKQKDTGSKDSKQREQVSNHISGIFERTQQGVNKRLAALDKTVKDDFSAGNQKATSNFERYVDVEMTKYKDERYSGAIGKLKWVKDKLLGLPKAVDAFYKEARRRFILEMEGVIGKIAKVVATELNQAKLDIDNGKKEVTKYVSDLPKDLQKIGNEAAQSFSAKFDELTESVNNKEKEIVDSVAQMYVESLQKIDERIKQMQEENKGFVQKAVEFIQDVWQNIVNFKNQFLALMSEAADALSGILLDPIGFLKLLIQGLKEGFDKFSANIWTHLGNGLVSWLTGAMPGANITIPDNLDTLGGVFNLAAQIMGISWDFVKVRASKLLGAKTVEFVESRLDLFVAIRKDGINGLWEYIKEEFNDLKETIIDAIKTMLMEQVIKAGIKWILSLLNPVAALFKAIKAIIDIVIFFVQRAAQIKELIVAFIDAVKAVSSGSLGKVATAVEGALARAVPVVIGFLAAFLGLNKIADKAMEIIKSIRKRVENVVDKLINGIAGTAKKLFSNKGKDGKDSKAKEKNAAGVPANKLQDSEVGQTETFKAKGHNHQLFLKPMSGGVEVWVRSEEDTVEHKLSQWEKNTAPSDQKGKSLISLAKNQNAELKKSGRDAQKLMVKAKTSTDPKVQDAAQKADDSVESIQHKLANTLLSLFTHFGEAPVDFKDLKLVVKVANQKDVILAITNDLGLNDHVAVRQDTQMALIAYLEKMDIKSNDEERYKAKGKLIKFAREINQIIDDGSGEVQVKTKKILDSMKDEIEIIYSGGKDGESSVPVFGALNQGGFGTSMLIRHLTKTPPPGVKGSNTAGVKNETFDILNQRRYMEGSFYKKGHLLNEHLYGPGEFFNMVPLTTQANSDHVNHVEKALKDGVAAGMSYSYEVKAHTLYPPSNLLNKLKSPEDDQLISIIKAEVYVPKFLEIKAHELKDDGSIGKNMGFPNIKNVIEQDSEAKYQLGNEAFKTVIINNSNVVELLTLPGMNQVVAWGIAEIVMNDIEYLTYEDLKADIKRFDNSFNLSIVDDWKNSRKILLYTKK